ncbi:MAG: cobalt ECF transporter T component CbiQ [Nitrospirae bacterium]|nr:cobalt ECF transporter T component CbiQ [Nitrospirota bacterium]
MRVEAFSEIYAAEGGFVREADARAKLVFTGACLLLAVASSAPAVPLTVGAVCLGILAASGVPISARLLRMSEPLVFALIIASIQAALTPGEAVAGFGIYGMEVSVSGPGVHKGAVILARVLGAVSTALFLTMTTPAHRLLSAAARLRMPRAFVEVALLTYRYVFVLLEDAVTVYHAQRGRLGYAGWRIGMRSLGTLAGSVLLRAYGQAEATGESMRMRGYTGEYVPAHDEHLRPLDAAFLGGAFAVCLTVFIWTS